MSDVQELVENAQNQETFSFAEVVQGRGYPRDEVAIYLDEATAYQISKLENEHKVFVEKRVKELEAQILQPSEADDEVDGEARAAEVERLDREIEAVKKSQPEGVAELRAKLNQSKYVFKIVGLSTQTREDLLEKARTDIKPEYESHKNFMTGQVDKVEKESPKRDRYYTNLLWQASIEQIVSPTGAVDTAPTLETIEAFRKAPLSQQAKFQNALNQLAVAAEVFEDQATDASFLAGS